MYLSLETALSVCALSARGCFPVRQRGLVFCCPPPILPLSDQVRPAVTDSYFAARQSQFSQLSIRLLQPLSLAACQLQRRPLHSKDVPLNLNGTCQPPWWWKEAHLSLAVCPSVRLFRLYFAAVYEVYGRLLRFRSVLLHLAKRWNPCLWRPTLSLGSLAEQLKAPSNSTAQKMSVKLLNINCALRCLVLFHVVKDISQKSLWFFTRGSQALKI